MSKVDKLSEAAEGLVRVRGRSCLVLSASPLEPAAVEVVLEAIAGRSGGEVDVVLRGPGGCSCCAYAVARDIRRRFRWVGAIVPLPAKSATTLLALAAEEIVIGNRGELGPLDAQISDKQQADFPVERSCLETTRVLDHLKDYALQAFHEAVASVIAKSGMRVEDACRVGTEFVGRLVQPLYSQIDLRALGASLRGNDCVTAYAERILRRYRPELWEENGAAIVERLVGSYPAHGFLIDAEELAEMGIPARAPSPEEAAAIEEIARALEMLPDKGTVATFVGIEDVSAACPAVAAA